MKNLIFDLFNMSPNSKIKFSISSKQEVKTTHVREVLKVEASASGFHLNRAIVDLPQDSLTDDKEVQVEYAVLFKDIETVYPKVTALETLGAGTIQKGNFYWIEIETDDGFLSLLDIPGKYPQSAFDF